MKFKLLMAFSMILIGLSVHAQTLKYGNGNNQWNADLLGNHRVVILYNGAGNVAHVKVEWRRRDTHPENKRIIIQDAMGKTIVNSYADHISRESADLYFDAQAGKGKYYAYYLPSVNEGRDNYPKGVYLKPDNSANQAWVNEAKNTAINAAASEIQSIDAFNSFYPMEVIATAKETAAIKSKHKTESFIVFPEDRMFPIKMQSDLPYRWVQKGPASLFSGSAAKGENYAFQLGVFALKNLQNVKVAFGNLKSTTGKIIDSKNINCLNTNGISYDDKPLTEVVNVKSGNIQPMWITVDVPKMTSVGVYTGKFTVNANGKSKIIDVKLSVSNEVLADAGVGQPNKQTRLTWLNSTMAQQNTVVAPYTPLAVEGNVISLLGRKVELNSDGFPKQIQTYFNSEMTGYNDKPNNILAEPIHFHFYTTPKTQEKLIAGNFQIISKEAGTVKWTATNTSDHLKMDVEGALEFDGYVHYVVKVTALKDVDFSNVDFHIPFEKGSTKYLMGLGEKGGIRPDTVKWKWDVANKNQDAVWVGNVNAGLYYNLRDENYVRPLNTNFYLQKPLLLPKSWGNENKGGIQINVKGSSMLADNFTGSRSMKKGDVLYYNFNLLITPFHLIDTDFQWNNRFYHKYGSLDSIKATGATVVNIHHATPINPWINYPFIEWKKMKTYVDDAHEKGLKVKIYNTVRELSNHAYELPALRSLGTEVYSPGKGGGFSWLQEHLDSNYIAAWFVPEIKDAAIINSGMNRWHNYYVEGMNWLVNNVGIDGVYLDDVAFDRVTMKRIKRVLTANNHPGIIDLHSANQYNKSDGFNNSAILYLEHFPYLNRLWFGEYFDYNKNNPDFFLTEVSGIPFGLMGEMLQDDGNQWRGMIYGMTSRLGWSEKSDPKPLWKAWDNFGIKGSELIGYWSDNCPVKTDTPKVLASIYKKKGKLMIAIASWAESDVKVNLSIDWTKLGINADQVKITAPAIDKFQAAGNYPNGKSIPVEKGKGLILMVE
ncbi:glycoside hydrolase domain-containing protein [Pedobacter nototheniae]|uniref:glycoside hydrolase domain-containing protein n=1 Tax=Pedobacter nototheniae TaxID=2488994 RepID=UPI00292D9E24|nr:glycoside hydrolase domain-containing protein [Pedobacter nototheniae]